MQRSTLPSAFSSGPLVGPLYKLKYSHHTLLPVSSTVRGTARARALTVASRSAAAQVDGSSAPAKANAQQHLDWDSFCQNVSGEWEGVTASFSPSGAPLPLPEHYVPEAFREWGVELWDWQSQCSSLAEPVADDSRGSAAAAPPCRRLRSVVRRLMPTVGCEADAIAFTEDDSSSSSTASATDTDSSSTLLFTASGSYCSGPGIMHPVSADNGPSKFSIEHCFTLPPASSSSSSNGGGEDGPSSSGSSSSSSSSQDSSRVRIKVVQQFRRDWSSGGWVLSAVDLHKERYDGPYTGKRELAGCGGGQPGIAQLPALQANCLAGSWVPDSDAGLLGGSSTGGSEAGGMQRPSAAISLSCLDSAGAAAAGVTLTLLPLQAWSAVALSAGGQLQRAEAGVVLTATQQQQGQEVDGCSSSSRQRSRVVSFREYDGATGQLEGAGLGQEVNSS